MKRLTRNFPQERIPFLSWIIIPILGAWIGTNYLIGIFQQPQWKEDSSNMDVHAQTGMSNQNTPIYHWDGEAILSFWFDDAWDSQYLAAFPLLEDKGFKAALAVPTSAIGWDTYMSWAQIKRVKYYGWEITAHSRSHNCDQSKFNMQTIEDELVGSQKDLEKEGFKTEIYVPPCGVITPMMLETAKKQYASLRTSDSGVNPLPISNPYNLLIYEVRNITTLKDVSSWIEEAKLSSAWLIIMFHKIDDSFEVFSARPEILKNIVKLVKDSKIPVVLPSQALNLVKNQ